MSRPMLGTILCVSEEFLEDYPSIKNLISGRPTANSSCYLSYTCTGESNCEFPTLEVWGKTKEEANLNLIKALEDMISDAKLTLKELKENN